MTMLELLEKKRHRQALSQEEIAFFVQGCTDGSLPDYQISALLMAICFAGMNQEETAALTMAMAHSGDLVDLSRFGTCSVDKHSTGGVGDKTTLILAPIVAALGGKVAKMSGRGLGHTGGTIDKLESIPGFRTALSAQEFLDQVQRIGVAVVGQTGNLAPADKRLYALRDVTATVDSMPLIASSVMSKKIAAGSASIVLDVKVGSGAFMKTQADGEALARQMVALGQACGRNMAALVTNMDAPLGRNIGNALEVQEASQVLRGQGCPHLRQLCVQLAAQMLCLCQGWPMAQSLENVESALNSGLAFEKFCQWVDAQGGDAKALTDFSRFPAPKVSADILAGQSGYLYAMDAQRIGEASMLLGAGRLRKEDPIDPAAGIVLHQTSGGFVEKGQRLLTLYASRPAALDAARAMLSGAWQFAQTPPQPAPLVYNRIG